MIEFYKMHNEVNAPNFSTQHSACFDISAFLSEKEQILSYDNQNHSFQKELQKDESKNDYFIKIKPFERIMIPTGLIFSFDCIYSLRIHARSGLSIKKGLVLANQEGVIDCDYNRQLFICILNLTNTEQRIYNGDRIAQGELVPNMHQLDSLSLKQISEKPKQFGNRTGGFGSTGV